MAVRSPWWALSGLAVILAALLVAGFAGALGPLVTCGAADETVCVAWPRLASAAFWLTFIATVAGLAVWHAREWRNTSVARREIVFIAALLAAALLERTWRIDLAEVGFDESSAASLVAAWRFQDMFPLMGTVSTVELPHLPGWPYLLAVALLPFDSPYALVGLGMATGLLTVLLTWWVGRRWIGVWGGLAAAAFYAGGFWSTFFGRGGWQPEFLQLPAILCLDALLVLALRRWPWALAIACGWLALMVQLHYIAILFAMVVPIAAWPARRALGAVHIAAAIVAPTLLLVPFFIYELTPGVRLRDVALVLSSSGGTGSHWDLESWTSFWTLAGNGGAAGLGGLDAEGLRQALSRWTNLGLVGVPLVGFGVLVAVAGWPRGWRGWLIAAWVVAPVLGLARHTWGVLFHYLYLGLPGMALAVGALAEWSSIRFRVAGRLAVGGALAVYAVVSAATLWVVLEHVDRTGQYPGFVKPLRLNMAAAEAARAALAPDGQVLVGGYAYHVEVLRFALGYHVPSRVFDDCGEVPFAQSAVYLLNSERTPAAASLAAAGAPLLARVPRPDDAFLIFGSPLQPPAAASPETNPAACRDRWG
jgi:hypothetical protein